MESTEDTSYEAIIQSASNPDDPLHNVYLLMELRKLKNEYSNKYIGKCKLEFMKGFVNNQNPVKGGQRSSSIKHSLGAEDCSASSVKRNSFPPGDGKSVSVRNTDFKKSLSMASLSNDLNDTCSYNSVVISNIISIVELICEFYNISDDNKFIQDSNQLMKTLSTLNNQKLSDLVSNNLIKKFEDLCDLKNKFQSIIRKNVPDLHSTDNLKSSTSL